MSVVEPPTVSGPRGSIFVTYDRADVELARALAAAIQRAGGLPWLDVTDLQYGDPIDDGILKGLEGAALVVVLVTERWLHGTDWQAPEEVQRAIERARRLGHGRIVPLLYDGTSPDALPYGTHRLKALPIAPGELDTAAQTLVRIVQGEERPPIDEPAPDAVPPEHAEPLRAWLSDVATRFENMPRLLRYLPTRSLSRLYVHLDQQVVDEQGARPLEQGVPTGPRTLNDLIRQAPGGRWTLMGDPGAGKTTHLRFLALDRAREALSELDHGRLGRARVPVFASLAVLDPARNIGPLDAAIADHGQHAMVRAEEDALKQALTWAVKEGRALLLLDGFDEVPPAAREGVRGSIMTVVNACGGSTVVLSSREMAEPWPDEDFLQLELLPLDRDRKKMLLHRWGLPPDRVEDVIAQLEARPALQDMAGNPLILTLVALIAREAPAQVPLTLPTRRVRLYQQVLDLLVAGRLHARRPDQVGQRTGRSHLPQVADGVLRAGLGDLALRLLRGHAGPWSTAELLAHTSRIPILARLAGQVECLPTALAADTGLLVATDGRRSTWEWRHRSLLECLAAEALHAGGTADARRFAAWLAGRRWHKPWTWRRRRRVGRWAEVYHFLVGMRDDPKEAAGFLKAIKREHPALAIRVSMGLDNLPIRRLLSDLGEADPLAVIRRLRTDLDDRAERVRIFVRLVRNGAADSALAQLAVAALVAEDATRELADLRLDAQTAAGLGVPATPWVAIPPGEFVMGSPGDEVGRFSFEGPQRRVKVGGFEMSATPVTQALYAVVVGQNPSQFRDWSRPVERVTWHEATAFCAALSDLQGSAIRLPTEAEWEYACRADTTGATYLGDLLLLGQHNAPTLHAIAWYGGNSGSRHQASQCTTDWPEKQCDHRRASTHPVGLTRPNGWGLYDMLGNVWEWCHDWYAPYPEAPACGSPVKDPTGPARGMSRVIRGGSWASYARWCRSAGRYQRACDSRDEVLGFRLVRPCRVVERCVGAPIRVPAEVWPAAVRSPPLRGRSTLPPLVRDRVTR